MTEDLYAEDPLDRDQEFWEPESDGGPAFDGCVLGKRCLCPHADHTSSECFDLEMAEAYAAQEQAP